MFRHPLFYAQLAILILVALLHSVGVYGALYWAWAPFDIIVHFLGGVWVALAALWLVFFTNLAPEQMRRFSMFTVTLVAIAVIGLAWELFELLIEGPGGAVYYQDTAIDIIVDVAGALSAWWFVRKTHDPKSVQQKRNSV